MEGCVGCYGKEERGNPMQLQGWWGAGGMSGLILKTQPSGRQAGYRVCVFWAECQGQRQEPCRWRWKPRFCAVTYAHGVI